MPGQMQPCGMVHPAAHGMCFRCGSKAPYAKKPSMPKAPVALPVAEAESAVVVMDVDTIAVANVKLPLGTLILRHTIKGPDIASLFRETPVVVW